MGKGENFHTAKTEKVTKLFQEWVGLKKNKENKKKRSNKLVEKEGRLNNKLDNLFGIAHKNALELIQIEEDRTFLLAQRESGRQGRMESIDKQLYEKKAEN